MKDIICKCGHPVSEHGVDTIGCRRCDCPTDFESLHRAIVEAAMRFEADTSNTNYEALIAAVRALKDATQ